MIWIYNEKLRRGFYPWKNKYKTEKQSLDWFNEEVNFLDEIKEEIIERAQNGIVRQLESSGENEISSDLIGELVMNALSQIDHVAYIRYASVYRNFREASDFGKFVKDEFQEK